MRIIRMRCDAVGDYILLQRLVLSRRPALPNVLDCFGVKSSAAGILLVFVGILAVWVEDDLPDTIGVPAPPEGKDGTGTPSIPWKGLWLEA
jgi:hypothetical protein